MMQKLFDYLADLGYEVYFPNQKTGECTSFYIVLKEQLTTSSIYSFKLGHTNIDVILYAPRTQTLALLDKKKEIKEHLKSYEGLFYGGYESPTIEDDSVKGITCSVTYRAQKVLI
ncbi:hypothetical protein [Clostridium luticellarii]|jgi:hypothetical protein|uniref:Phage protein n=1 Tax=Clostridium luticellarii TaxID=1691940 RepID=A0A2T0BLH4_9CLOT|nr:hypothetical protein [Clostridium luticellarii]PRR84744.1 hypothetical protein CLLU_22830 [Clostridium luticellarii]